VKSATWPVLNELKVWLAGKNEKGDFVACTV